MSEWNRYELGGDCFDYAWIDDDHLIVYLLDVSGHGIEPALLAASVQNVLRSGVFSLENLLAPGKVLDELNRLFPTESQGDHFFTIWYGVYEASTRTLRYSSAGTPPAFAFTSAPGTRVATTELSTPGPPVGVSPEVVFTSRDYRVPPGCQVLLYSDGVSEAHLADGNQLSQDGFATLATRVARSSHWSPDDIIDEIRTLTASDVFVDDCSLIQLTFD